MSSQLSKLHVRYIQTQKKFYLLKNEKNGAETLPISQLYVRDNASFYLINLSSPIEEKSLIIHFKEATDTLKSLRCKVVAHEVEKTNTAFEDALLFFNVDRSKVNQLLLLTIDTLNSDA